MKLSILMMNNLCICYIQADLKWQDKQANLEHFSELLKEVKPGTDLVLLPETFNTAFPVDPKEFAETEDGPTMQWMRQKAQALNAVICGTLLIEKDGTNSITGMMGIGALSHVGTSGQKISFQ